MTDKKFPTPNLDAWNDGIEGSFRDVNEAAQADIALAVEKAAKVPEGVNFQITWNLQTGWSMYAIHPRQELIDCAIKYLESLTIAPMEAPDLVPMQFVETRTKTGENTFSVDSIEPVEPVEKRCGTCAHRSLSEVNWGNRGQEAKCDHPRPHGLDDDSDDIWKWMPRGAGKTCPCWKAKG